MNKQQIKTLVESDDKLQWWAAILFAEISDYVPEAERAGLTEKSILNFIKHKLDEFPQIVLNHTVDNASRPTSQIDDIDKRLRRLELLEEQRRTINLGEV